jgi:hypothetical protein
MAMERRDTDKHNEELRAEADEVERKVSPCLASSSTLVQRRDLHLCRWLITSSAARRSLVNCLLDIGHFGIGHVSRRPLPLDLIAEMCTW